MEGVTVIGTTEKQIEPLQRPARDWDASSCRSTWTYKKNVLRHRLRGAQGLFGTADPINKIDARSAATNFRVIGVMEKQGGSFLGGPNFDRQVFVPITTYVKRVRRQHGRAGREHRGQGARARRR